MQIHTYIHTYICILTPTNISTYTYKLIVMSVHHHTSFNSVTDIKFFFSLPTMNFLNKTG